MNVVINTVLYNTQNPQKCVCHETLYKETPYILVYKYISILSNILSFNIYLYSKCIYLLIVMTSFGPKHVMSMHSCARHRFQVGRCIQPINFGLIFF